MSKPFDEVSLHSRRVLQYQWLRITFFFQKILGLTIKTGIKLFGYSLSGGVDVDENGYPGMS